MSNLEVTMIMQRLEKEDDLYSMEVRNLLSEGGLERLIGQYRTISRRLDKMSTENRELQKNTKNYEDKIAKLEKELEEWKEEARVVKKQRDEQLKSFRKGIEPYVDLLHMHETIAELKQRIAELESEKSEKLTKHTEVIVAREINGQEYVRLEDFASVVNDLQAEIGT